MATVISRQRAIANCSCGAQIEYGPRDVHTGGSDPNDPYDMEYEPRYKYIQCPDCHDVIKLHVHDDSLDMDC